jgi:hypothetical protein
MRRDWYKNGGGGDIMLCIGFLPMTLPLIPMRDPKNVQLEAPSFGSLLSRRDFFHRCELVKSALKRHLERPLFVETAARTGEFERSRLSALLWKKTVNGESIADKDRAAVAKAVFGASATDSPVFSFGGATIGNVRIISVFAYIYSWIYIRLTVYFLWTILYLHLIRYLRSILPLRHSTLAASRIHHTHFRRILCILHQSSIFAP